MLPTTALREAECPQQPYHEHRTSASESGHKPKDPINGKNQGLRRVRVEYQRHAAPAEKAAGCLEGASLQEQEATLRPS